MVLDIDIQWSGAPDTGAEGALNGYGVSGHTLYASRRDYSLAGEEC